MNYSWLNTIYHTIRSDLLRFIRYNNVGKLINSEESVWKTEIEKLGNI